LIHHRRDPARSENPILAQLKRDRRLNVQDILYAAELANGEVDIVLKRNADEVAHWILKCGEQLVVIPRSLGGKETYGGERKGETACRLPHIVAR
jgi:hypothetical protein